MRRRPCHVSTDITMSYARGSRGVLFFFFVFIAFIYPFRLSQHVMRNNRLFSSVGDQLASKNTTRDTCHCFRQVDARLRGQEIHRDGRFAHYNPPDDSPSRIVCAMSSVRRFSKSEVNPHSAYLCITARTQCASV